MGQAKATAVSRLEHLAVEIGPRPLGSKQNHAATDFVSSSLKASGLETALQEFICPLWENSETHFELGGKRYVAAANTFAPPCDVAARGVALGTLAELEKAELAGRIAVLYGDLTAGTGFSARAAYYFPERDRLVFKLLEEKKPAAVITIHSQPGSLQRLITDWEFPIPSLTVPAEVGLMLLGQIGQPLRLRIDSQQTPSCFSNVIGRKGGTRRERVVFCAHLDSIADAPGAIDNGSGVAVLLTLAEALAKREWPLGMEFIAFNGHENGGIGCAEYLRREGAELGKILAAINMDGVGQTVGANSLAMFASSRSFQDQVARVCKGYPGVARVDPWYESDHTAFCTRGVPSVAISSRGVANVMHLPADTIDWISASKLGEVVSLVTELVEFLQDKPLDWTRVSGELSVQHERARPGED
jgi:aminopeptidase YwaD